MNKNWIYTTNFILSACENSYANALRLSSFHLSSLHVAIADPAILAMYNAFLPLDTNLTLAYSKWKAQEGTKQGNTLGYAQLEKQIIDKLNTWDPAIQLVYKKSSSAYKAIFPNGRSVFQRGTQDDRKAAINALSISLTGIAALATTKTDVTNFYNQLVAAYTAKTEALQQTNNLSDALAAAVLAMSIQQFINYGSLVVKYGATPSKIDPFFDLENIRYHKQTDFTHKLPAGKSYVIAKRTVQPNDFIRIFNTGDTTLRFYFGETKLSKVGTEFFDASPGSISAVPASQFGDISNDHYLTVVNLDDSLAGSFDLELP